MTSENVEIWHNPRCSKSRTAKQALDDAGISYTERRYLEDVPSVAEIGAMLDRLGLEPWDITRTGEPVAKELGITGWSRTPADREHWIETLAHHPKLIQRPIVANSSGAVVARDEQSLRSML